MQPNPTDQIYDSSLLLGALLRITGLSIIDVQNIIQGHFTPVQKPNDVRNYIFKDMELRKTFVDKILTLNLNIDVINECLGTKYEINELQNRKYDSYFNLNYLNFAATANKSERNKLILAFSDKERIGKKLTNKEIANILGIDVSSVNNFKRNMKRIKNNL